MNKSQELTGGGYSCLDELESPWKEIRPENEFQYFSAL